MSSVLAARAASPRRPKVMVRCRKCGEYGRGSPFGTRPEEPAVGFLRNELEDGWEEWTVQSVLRD